MADDLSPQEFQPHSDISTNIEIDSNRLIQARFKNWVFDPELSWGEKHARDMISTAAGRDLARSQKGEVMDENQILSRIEPITLRLEERMRSTGDNYLNFERSDKVSGGVVVTEVRKDETVGWTAVERRKSDGSIIAQARISPSGSTDLTLQYPEDRFVKRNANPDIVADSRFQEATIVTFDRLAEEVLEKQLKGWVIQEIRDGKDAHGRRIYDSYQASLFDPEHSVGDIAITFQKALTSKENLDRPGELNKLLSSLNSLHKQIGGEGYKPEIDISEQLEGVEDEKERTRIRNDAITKAALNDLDNFPSLFAAREIEAYAEAKAKVIEKEEDIRRLVDKDSIDRDEIRLAAYKLAKDRKGLIRVIGKDATRVGNEWLGIAIKKDLEEETSQREGFIELKPEDKARLVESAKEGYVQELFAKGEFRYGNLLADKFDETETNNAFGSIAEIDNQITSKRENLRAALSADPDTLCRLVSEIKELQLQRKAEKSKVRIKIVEKSGEDVEERWKVIREEVGPKIVKFGIVGARDSGSRLLIATREWLASKGNLLKERFKKNIEPTVGRFSDLISQGKGEVVGVLTTLDEELLGALRGEGQGVIEGIKGTIQDTKGSYLKISDDLERRRIAVNKNLRIARYEAGLWLAEKKVDVLVKERAWMWEQQTKAGIFIGGEKVREQFKGRLERIKKVSEADFKRRVARIREKDNPYLDVFQRDLEKRVKLIEKAKVEEIVIPEDLPVENTQVVKPSDEILQGKPGDQSPAEAENSGEEKQNSISDDELFGLIEANKSQIDIKVNESSVVLDGGNEEFDTTLREYQGRLIELRQRTDNLLDPNYDYSSLGEDYQKYMENRANLDQLKGSFSEYSGNRTVLMALLGEYQEQLQSYRELVKNMKSKTK